MLQIFCLFLDATEKNDDFGKKTLKETTERKKNYCTLESARP